MVRAVQRAYRADALVQLLSIPEGERTVLYLRGVHRELHISDATA